MVNSINVCDVFIYYKFVLERGGGSYILRRGQFDLSSYKVATNTNEIIYIFFKNEVKLSVFRSWFNMPIFQKWKIILSLEYWAKTLRVLLLSWCMILWYIISYSVAYSPKWDDTNDWQSSLPHFHQYYIYIIAN